MLKFHHPDPGQLQRRVKGPTGPTFLFPEIVVQLKLSFHITNAHWMTNMCHNFSKAGKSLEGNFLKSLPTESLL